MSFGADIAGIAALMGDRGRAAMLAALVDGRALPAGQLAGISGPTAQAATIHLAKLVAGGLLAVERQGRHHYYRLAGPHMAAVLESIAAASGPPSPRLAVNQTLAARDLRYARRCYAHLAGELGVAVAATLEARGLLVAEGPKQLRLSQAGATWFSDALGFDVTTLRPGANGLACRCLDWTERRYHIAGPLGNTMLRRWLETGWLVPKREERALRLTRAGQDGFHAMLGIGDDLTYEAA
jgi:DNA-binding transcriptional ArsR family regulator